MTDLDLQEKRIENILKNGNNTSYLKDTETIQIYFKYLKDNIELPLKMSGIEDFYWEEKYVMGEGNKKEYEKLKKTNPSYTDIFEFIDFEEIEDYDEQIFVKVRRESDNKNFILELDQLESIDKKSKNYQLLEDFVTWFVNY
ncbi:MAG: calcium-binding protein [Candidatus Gracilibacteria bacterium]|nr:calcium-binding protein [Candidatus Gracilibacteria bacterium]